MTTPSIDCYNSQMEFWFEFETQRANKDQLMFCLLNLIAFHSSIHSPASNIQSQHSEQCIYIWNAAILIFRLIYIFRTLSYAQMLILCQICFGQLNSDSYIIFIRFSFRFTLHVVIWRQCFAFAIADWMRLICWNIETNQSSSPPSLDFSSAKMVRKGNIEPRKKLI